MKKLFLILTALFVCAMMWAETVSDTIFVKGFANGTSTSYVNSITEGQSQLGVTVKAQQYNPTTGQIKGNQTNYANQFLIYNTTAFPGAITNIAVVAATDGSNYLKNKMYAAIGTESQAEITSVDGLAAWGNDFTWSFDEQDNNTYFKLLSNEKFTSGNVKEAKVIVTYVIGTTPQRTLQSIYIAGTATELEYTEGESFDPAGLKVMGKYDKGDDTEITSGITWTIDPETFTEASDNASVKLSASYKDKTSEDKTITGIKVNAVVPKMDKTFDFTTNLYGHKGVSSGSGDNYVSDGDIAVCEKFNEDPTQIEFTVNGSTQTRFWDASSKHELRLYNGAAFVLSVVGDYKIIKVEFTGSAVNLTGNGVTVSNKVWEGDAAKSVKFVNTATASKINSIKVTYIAADPAAANPTITPSTVADVYWEPITVTLACETEGADIYYTLDGSEPTASATKYTAPFSVPATTTVKAIAIKSGLDNSEVVSKTFTFGTFFTSLEELVEKQPATEDAAHVQVTITDAVIDSLYLNSSGYTNGIYVTAANTVVELYTNNVPNLWEVGGKVSGSIKAEWLLYKGVPELQKWEGGWSKFTYTAPPGPTVDKTGITVNGRKYGFPIRLVKDVPAAE